MQYWRMQLHPDDAKNSAFYSQQSLAAGLIGLDFATEVGDLLASEHKHILSSQKDYLYFAKDMKVGDKVLIISHHYPVAVVTVSGEYNYIRRTEPEIGVWFRHFRRVQDIKYFADHVTNAKSWEQYIMTDTISILKDKNSKSYKLIDAMVK
ncbi:hypothetical protein N9L48_05035 [Psychrosphaera sp.]|nr:hypothetical protein [Psychrosphaera sp.]